MNKPIQDLGHGPRMTTATLPTRQRQVLQYILAYIGVNHALPSLAALTATFGWRSLNSARCAVVALEKKSWLARNEAGQLMLHPGRFAVTVQATSQDDADHLAVQVRQARPAPRVAPRGHIDLNNISAAQARVFDALVTHGSNKGAAAALGLSVKTIEAHRAALRKATGARTSLGAICAWAQARAMEVQQP